MAEDNGWSEYKLLVLRHIEDDEKFQGQIVGRLDSLITTIAGLQTALAVSITERKLDRGIAKYVLTTIVSAVTAIGMIFVERAFR